MCDFGSDATCNKILDTDVDVLDEHLKEPLGLDKLDGHDVCSMLFAHRHNPFS